MVLVAPLLLATTARSAGAAGGASNASAFEAIGRCFAAQKHVLLAFVIDESASLGDAALQKPGTDPTARRVTAAQVAVDGIANLAKQGTRVDVILTGFSDDLHVYGGWQSLDGRSRAGIEQQLEGFRGRAQGLDTDFYNAIAGVQTQLARRAATLDDESQPCELVLLFTDGRFDIDSHVPKPYEQNADAPKDTKAAEGIAALCAAGGPMQRLRLDGARTITLALADPSRAAPGQPDRAFLERLATGDCSVPGAQFGASFDATNAADLVGQFDAIATRLRGGTELAGDCSAKQTLRIVPAVRAFHVFADAGTRASDVVITPPGGKPVRINPTNGRTPTIAGVELRTTATGNRFVVIEASPASGATTSPRWSGRWSIGFAHPGNGTRCRTSVFEAWKPRVRDVTLQRGVSATLTFDIAGDDGKPAPAGAFGAGARVTASVSDGSTSATPVPLHVVRVGTQFEAKYTLPTSFTAQTAIVTSVLHLRLAGTDVASTPSATELRVRAQSGFPSIAQAKLRLPGVSGRGTSRATVDIVGDAGVPGVVCLDRVEYPTAPPVPAAKLVATPSGTCVKVAAGGRAQLVFTVDVKAEADGRVNGRVHFTMTGLGGKKTEAVVPFTLALTHSISTTTRNTLFFVLLLGGVVAPLLLLLALGNRAAAFMHPAGLRAARIRVRVFADGTMRRLEESGASPPLSFEETDFDDAGIDVGRVRSFEWCDLIFDARWSWNPFAAPHGEVSVDGHYVTASDGVLSGRRELTKGRVPLTLPGTWVFALDSATERVDDGLRAVDGTVSVFIAAGAPFRQQAPRMMKSLRDFFRQLIESLESAASEARTQNPESTSRAPVA
jgi:hypothetical protein